MKSFEIPEATGNFKIILITGLARSPEHGGETWEVTPTKNCYAIILRIDWGQNVFLSDFFHGYILCDLVRFEGKYHEIVWTCMRLDTVTIFFEYSMFKSRFLRCEQFVRRQWCDDGYDPGHIPRWPDFSWIFSVDPRSFWDFWQQKHHLKLGGWTTKKLDSARIIPLRKWLYFRSLKSVSPPIPVGFSQFF